jgi:hypothetical protein
LAFIQSAIGTTVKGSSGAAISKLSEQLYEQPQKGAAIQQHMYLPQILYVGKWHLGISKRESKMTTYKVL